jgi:uncharacterized membrane protein YccC|tara:strand:- start:58427 stop:60526 length:2100 start_codon:yes stop_codon:yes gene_type:complete
MYLIESKQNISLAIEEWINKDLPIFKYIIKSTTAGLLALCICMYFNLAMPQTSVFTVFIVMQPFSGLVFSKSYYRFVGTVIGTIMAIILVGAFAQDRVSFTLFFALWVGLCSVISFMSRNFMSYGFVLTGYTIALVAMPTIENPLNVFTYGIDRLSEVVIGLLCASFISEILFPQKLSNTLLKGEKSKFNLLISSFSNSENLFDFEKGSINYTRDILGSDALRVNSSFETNMKKTDKLYYKRLNSQFMHINTTFFSLRNTINNNKDNSEFINSLKKIYADFEKCLSNYSNSNNLSALINEIKIVKDITKIRIEDEKKSLALDDFDLIHDFNSITSLFLRLESEIYDYCNTYYNFTTNSDKIKRLEKFAENLKFSTYSDNVLISLMIIRASITLIVVMCIWMISGWEYGSLAVLPAVANTLLLSTAPNPVGATKNFLKGAAVGFIITPIYNFYIIPMYVSDLFTLCLFLTPVLAGISLFMILPGKNLIGFGFLLIFITTCSIHTQYNVSFDTFMDMNIATVIGLLFSGLSFILINFTSNIWIESRVKKALSKQIEITTKDKLALQRVRLESASFDLIQRYSALGRLDNKSNNKILRWVLSILEIGKAIINIRRNATLFTKSKPSEISRILSLIRKFFDLKDKNDKEEQMKEIKELINKFEQVHLRSANDQKLLKDIYLDFSIIYSLMKNKEFLPIKGETL